MRRAVQASRSPYEEDENILLPAGCFAEDIDMDIIDDGALATAGGVDANGAVGPHQPHAPRELTFGLENGPMASGVKAADHHTISVSAPVALGDAEAAAKPRCCPLFCASSSAPVPKAPVVPDSFGRIFSLGERVADKVSATVGSWNFVIIQSICLAIWLACNIILPAGPDPYPFILLNLMLSFQAAYTAPIIMMSQNRQSDIDRDKAFDLHEKVDHIRLNQVWALWDQLQLQQKKIDAIGEGVDRVTELVLRAAAFERKPSSASVPTTATTEDESTATTEASSAIDATADDTSSIVLDSISPTLSSTSSSSSPSLFGVPCKCSPPNMCDTCMHVLERAKVSFAYLQHASHTYIPKLATSYPTTQFTPTTGSKGKPLGEEYLGQNSKAGRQASPTRVATITSSSSSASSSARILNTLPPLTPSSNVPLSSAVRAQRTRTMDAANAANTVRTSSPAASDASSSSASSSAASSATSSSSASSVAVDTPAAPAPSPALVPSEAAASHPLADAPSSSPSLSSDNSAASLLINSGDNNGTVVVATDSSDATPDDTARKEQ